MRLYFIRHGKTQYNKQEIFQGLCDSPLTEEGIESARKIGDFLKDEEISKIYSSPMERSKKTADIINGYCQVDVEYLEQLKEICYGCFEGKRKEDLRSLPIWKDRQAKKFEFVHPGQYKGIKGQSYLQKYEELKEFFDFLLGKKENVLIVGHSGVCIAAYNFFGFLVTGKIRGYIKHDHQSVYQVNVFYQGKIEEKIIKIE
jgi:broad specificity phosphatase PhoE